MRQLSSRWGRRRTRLIVAAGTESVGQLPYRAAIVLADALMVPLTELPGDHRGFVNQPEPFARALDRLL